MKGKSSMQVAIISLLFVMLGGVAITIQNIVSGEMASKTASITSVFIIQLSGTILSGLIILFMKGNPLKGWTTIPWYMFFVGLSGIIVILSMVYSIPRIGVSGAVSGQLIAMLTCSALIDHFGAFGVERIPLTPLKLVGMLTLIVGVFLVLKK
jgi:transporter family-2 protein